jgi:hypothetical protein
LCLGTNYGLLVVQPVTEASGKVELFNPGVCLPLTGFLMAVLLAAFFPSEIFRGKGNTGCGYRQHVR